ncbi:ATP-grasp domain-containing protein [Pantoea ananatis]|uniref:ATP-grasp domain-containing protein n=1 Tax=Pantoea ananas TaxID=553 RepID=UPI001F4EFE95|nr:ATP-grasp domain-containing protein [Pantoea ananatis]MCH9271755.1 ATP-grasp domain-containing protein [Pantoea ananatis]
MHIVFVDSNRIGLQALRAAKQAGHQVTYVGSRRLETLVDNFDSLRDPTLTDDVRVIDTAQDEVVLLDTLRSINTNRTIDAMLTVIEVNVAAVARCAQALGLQGTSPEAVVLSQDKALCRQRIAEHGLNSVAYQVVDNLADARKAASRIGYPMIAKPKCGAASLRALKLKNDADLVSYFDSLNNPVEGPAGYIDAMSDETLLEYYVEGPLFSVEVAVADGDIQPLVLSWRKRCTENPAIELGTTIPAPVPDNIRDVMFEYTTNVVRACELNLGIFHIELIYGLDGPVLVEINPRIMGGNIPAVFNLATDIDPFALLIDIFLNGKLPAACRNLKAVRGAVTRSLGPKTVASLPDDFNSQSWDDSFRPLLSKYSYHYEAGMNVPDMNSTWYPYHFQLVSPSAIEASLLAEWIIMTAEEKTGLDLRHSNEDYLLIKL